VGTDELEIRVADQPGLGISKPSNSISGATRIGMNLSAIFKRSRRSRRPQQQHSAAQGLDTELTQLPCRQPFTESLLAKMPTARPPIFRPHHVLKWRPRIIDSPVVEKLDGHANE